MWTKPVYSSNVSEIGYDAEKKELYVTWTRGGRGTYLGVPEEVAVDLSNTTSVGTMIHAEIKPNYSYRRG